MGMFDWVECEYDIPHRPLSMKDDDQLFQTKDLDNGLHKYTIDKFDNLFKETDWGCGDDEFKTGKKFEPYTGWINFYTYEDHKIIQYDSEFFRGKLQAIKERIIEDDGEVRSEK